MTSVQKASREGHCPVIYCRSQNAVLSALLMTLMYLQNQPIKIRKRECQREMPPAEGGR